MPFDLITYIGRRGKRSIRDRKLRLTGCAFLRYGWDKITEPELREAVQVAELFADGECGDTRRFEQAKTVAGMLHWLKSPYVQSCHHLLDPNPLQGLRGCMSGYVRDGGIDCHFVRDIFGNPFRPVTFAPEWRIEAAIGIASQMYDCRDFGNMPILADALQDAGCEHADVLTHCREPGTHVRGCWVVDLVLGKS